MDPETSSGSIAGVALFFVNLFWSLAAGGSTGAASIPHSPVNTTRLITRGLVSANRSRQSAGKRAAALSRALLVIGSPVTQSIFGSVLNWWNGGGLGRVHSRVVAPSPQGLSGAFLPAASDHRILTKNTATPAIVIM